MQASGVREVNRCHRSVKRAIARQDGRPSRQQGVSFPAYPASAVICPTAPRAPLDIVLNPSRFSSRMNIIGQVLEVNLGCRCQGMRASRL